MEVRPVEPDAAQVGPCHVGVRQVAAPQVGAEEEGPAQVRATQVVPAEVTSHEVGTAVVDALPLARAREVTGILQQRRSPRPGGASTSRVTSAAGSSRVSRSVVSSA